MKPDSIQAKARVGVTIIGDDMRPDVFPGDRLELAPDEPVQPGKLVVGKMKTGGYLCRRLDAIKDGNLQMSTPAGRVLVMPQSAFEWVHRVSMQTRTLR